jgi:hypothetical protein
MPGIREEVHFRHALMLLKATIFFIVGIINIVDAAQKIVSHLLIHPCAFCSFFRLSIDNQLS